MHETDVPDTETPETSRWIPDCRERRFFLVMSALCLVGLVVLFFGHPTSYSLMPRCPFYLLTGLYCPGCGSLRATHYLLQGDVTSSIRHHPLFLPLLLFILVLYGKRLYEFRFKTTVSFRGELYCCVAVLVLFVLFFVMRNIPIDTLEWTRPPEPVLETVR